MRVSLRQVEIFCVLAKELHFGRAAEELFITQAVVSQELRRLERLIGVRLFDRTTRKVQLTEQGSTFLPTAQAVYDASRYLNRVASHLAESASTPVRLAASPSAMDFFVPQLLKEVDVQSAGAVEEIAVETGRVDHMIESDQCDVGIGRYITMSGRYEVEHIYDDEVYVVLSTLHPLAREAAIDLKDLANLPLLLWARDQHPLYYDALIAICHERGLEPLIMTGRPHIIGARSYLLSENRVFALIPRPAVTKLQQPGLVARPLARRATVPMSMAWLRDDSRPSVRRLVSITRRLASDPTRVEAPI